MVSEMKMEYFGERTGEIGLETTLYDIVEIKIANEAQKSIIRNTKGSILRHRRAKYKEIMAFMAESHRRPLNYKAMCRGDIVLVFLNVIV